MKRFITLIATLLILGQPAAALALAGGPTLSAQTITSSVAVNGQFTVTVQMNTKTYQVTAAELHLTFPSDKLQALSIVAGSFLPNTLTAGSVGAGTAAITVGSGTDPKQGTGTVATITFKALAAGTAQIGFASNTQVAASGQASNAVDTMTPVSVTITGAQSSTTPTATVTAAPSATVTPAQTPRPSVAPTPRPTGLVQGVSQVSTGPLEITLMAIILGCITTILYVGYMGTDAFRRDEAQSIAKQEKGHSGDFRDGQ